MDLLCVKHCQSTEWSLHCSMLSFRLKGRWTHLLVTHCQSTELSLHCLMLLFRLKGRWTPPSTLSELRVISSLLNVVIQTQRQMDLLCAKHCQSTELSLHCSMLSLRLKGRWTRYVPQPDHRVISTLFDVVIESKADGLPFNTVRAQSDLFTVQCCYWDSKADGSPWSKLSENRVIPSLFNVVIHTQRQMDPPVNTVGAQSDLFTV